MDDVRFPPNTYRGRALTFCYGYTSKGNEKIDVLCEIVSMAAHLRNLGALRILTQRDYCTEAAKHPAPI